MPVSDRTRRVAGASVGTVLLGLVVVAGLFGSQDGPSNPANYLVWLYFWPGVPIVVALVGDFWRYVNPWRSLGALLLERDPAALQSKGVWPAVAAFAAFAWFDLASGLSDRPRILAVAALVFTAFMLVPAAQAGARRLAGAEPFGLVTRGIGRGSLPAMLGLSRSADDPAVGWDRFALFLLPLAAAIFDAAVATPQWLSAAAAVGGATGLERGGLIFMAARTAGLAISVLAVAALILGVSAIVRPNARLARTATHLALVTLPAAVALMAAHNLPALLQFAPLLPAVLGAFLTGHSAVASVSPAAPIAVTSVSPLWTAEVVLIILGFVWSAWLAWRELRSPCVSPMDRFAAAYPAWIMLLLTSSAALFILYQPAAAFTAR